MTAVLKYPTNSADALSGSVVHVNDLGLASVNVGTLTGGVLTTANNASPQERPHTFVSSPNVYAKIFASQCNRVHTFVSNKLEQLDRADEDQNEKIVDSIAKVFDLMGEPAMGTASLDAKTLEQEDQFRLEHLLLALALTDHKETEAYRLRLLRHFTRSEHFRVRRAALRAIGRIGSPEAREILLEISQRSKQGELERLATALLR